MLQPGDAAPSFVLASDGGRTVDSATLKGRRHVLYFYPKDDTPGCTREACAFRDELPAFDKLGVPVFGVSADDAKAHDKFVHKHGLNFPLLADPEHRLLDAYGAWVEKNMYGRKYFGVQRSTFVIDARGRIEKTWEKVSPEGHAEEVMAYLTGATAPARRTIAKTVVKKAVGAKKLAAKKAVAKQAAAKKAVTGKAPAKKAAAKKTPAPR